MNSHHITSYPTWNTLPLQMAQAHDLNHADLRQLLHRLRFANAQGIANDLQTLNSQTRHSQSIDDLIQTPIAHASVLVALTNERHPMLLLTKRASHITAHAGEIAFAGGKYEPADTNNIVTALRESLEEVNLDPTGVRLLGQLPTQTSKSGLVVRPIVAVIPPNLSLQAEQGEIERIFWADWQYLRHAPTVDYHLITQVAGQSMKLVTPCWQVDGETVWGLTGRIIASLLKVGFDRHIEWYYRQQTQQGLDDIIHDH